MIFAEEVLRSRRAVEAIFSIVSRTTLIFFMVKLLVVIVMAMIVTSIVIIVELMQN